MAKIMSELKIKYDKPKLHISKAIELPSVKDQSPSSKKEPAIEKAGTDSTSEPSYKSRFSADNPVLYTSKSLKPNTVTPYAPTIEHLPKVFNDPSHLLIMDLEFFQNTGNNGKPHQHPREIAGRIFGTHDSFNYPIMDPSMPTNNQLEFLKTTDLPYSQTKIFKIDAVLKRVANFIDYHDIHTIISWDNSLDFKVLHQDSNNQILHNMYAIDLSVIIAQALFDNASPVPSLKHFCKLLNLQNPGKYHVAINDVNMIYKIVETYAYQLLPH